MAYDDYLADRIRNVLKTLKADFTEMKMMGGLMFKVDEKMLCGIHIDKKYGDSLLMARIGLEAYEEAIKMENTLPMDFTGRPLRGFIYVTPDGFDLDEQLEYWIDLCLQYNPLAKASPRKKKKKST